MNYQETNDVRERLREVADTIRAMLPPGTGFALLCFDTHDGDKDKPGRLEYVSNGDREGVVKAMREFITKTELGWGKHLDTGIPL